jgi:2-polyprenyl-6-methoxyphenol hydroxylase-like FAD-dependent oxidoreductase
LEQQEESVSVYYKDSTRSSKQLQARWLIGADGKRGVVRKMFLEKVADIRQVETAYRYEGTWVAANLKLRAPTPGTHPDFPLWKLGMTPLEVYDLFWPKGWHFCAPPGKPTASGRFGPYESGYWRHEYRQDGWDPKTMDAEKMFWEHLIPMVTRTSGRDNIPFPSGAVTFPRDCIDIVRCRPFTFSHKVVNRWFSGRTILIGDAAHVFPPFGGQGIASGVRDAHQLAWRIALMDGMPNLKAPVRERLLESWACERTKSVAAAATITWINGLLANTYLPPLVWAFWLLHWLVNTLSLKFLDYDPQITQEQLGFSNVSGGTFLSRYRGGLKLPQIYIDTLFEKQTPSDALLASDKSIFKLFILVPEDPAPATKVGDIEALLAASEIPKHVLSSASISIVSLGLARPDSLGHYSETHKHKAAPSPLSQISPRLVRKGYSIHAFKERFGPRARFIIARPDSYVFAVANNLQELRYCLDGLKKTCEGTR